MRNHKGFPLSKETRKQYEDFLKEHEPYPDGAPELDFDADKVMKVDPERSTANVIKSILEMDDKIRSEKKE